MWRLGGVLLLAGACQPPPGELGPDHGFIEATCALVAEERCQTAAECTAGGPIGAGPLERCIVDETRACQHELWALPVLCQFANIDAMQLCALELDAQSCAEKCTPEGACAGCGPVLACEGFE